LLLCFVVRHLFHIKAFGAKEATSHSKVSNVMNVMEQSPSSEPTSNSASQEIPHIYEPKVSLACSQETTTGSYPEPVESSPCVPTLFL
jgi:phage terminase small subunit